jgi:hypothetical protein
MGKEKQQQNGIRRVVVFLSQQESITNSPRRKGLENNNLQTESMSG